MLCSILQILYKIRCNPPESLKDKHYFYILKMKKTEAQKS